MSNTSFHKNIFHFKWLCRLVHKSIVMDKLTERTPGGQRYIATISTTFSRLRWPLYFALALFSFLIALFILYYVCLQRNTLSFNVYKANNYSSFIDCYGFQ